MVYVEFSNIHATYSYFSESTKLRQPTEGRQLLENKISNFEISSNLTIPNFLMTCQQHKRSKYSPDRFNSKWFLLVTTRSSAFLYQQGNFLPSSLCRQHQEKLDELARLEENLHQETQAKENRNLQIVELEQTLAKESQRASDLKVTRETHCVLKLESFRKENSSFFVPLCFHEMFL